VTCLCSGAGEKLGGPNEEEENAFMNHVRRKKTEKVPVLFSVLS